LNLKSSVYILKEISPSELSRVLLSPLLKNRWLYCFCFFPLEFFFNFFFHSIPARNSANWWVYYCGIASCFGLGLYHHKSNSKPTHTMQRAKSKGQWTIGPGFFNLEIFPILFFLSNWSSFGITVLSKWWQVEFIALELGLVI